MKRLKQLLIRPSSKTAGTDRLNRNPVDFRHFGHASSHSVYCKETVVSRVPGLLNASFPSHVRRFVMAVIINSSESHSGFLLSDVLKKNTKVFPFFANLDSPSTVIFPLFVSWVSATVVHGFPNPPKPGHFTFPCLAVFDVEHCFRHGIGFFNVVLSSGRPGDTGARCESTISTHFVNN